MTERILCPTDLSEASARALHYAVRYLAGRDAEIHVLHVDEPLGYGLDEQVAEQPLGGAPHERLGRLVARYGDEARLEVVTRRGRPAVEIGAYTEAAGIDLIVMATRGRPALARLFLGAVADKVVRTSMVPVVTVDPDARLDPIRRLLCPVDFSPASDAALAEATRLAERHAAQIHLLHVCQLPVTHFLPETSGGFDVTTGASLAATATRSLEALAARHPSVQPIPEPVLFGSPHETILRRADEISASLIVMGTHGRTGIARFVLGSVAERVLRSAEVPVMVAHGGAAPAG